MYYNVVVGCSSTDVNAGALQVEGLASFCLLLFTGYNSVSNSGLE